MRFILLLILVEMAFGQEGSLWRKLKASEFGAPGDICELPSWNRDLMDHVSAAYKKLAGRTGNVRMKIERF